MSEMTIFGLALLAVPVFARFARVSGAMRKMYHLIGLGGLFFLLGEATRLTATKIGIFSTFLPAMDFVTSMIAFMGVMAGTLWVAFYYVSHFKEA